MSKLLVKLASKLLGENVEVILEKIHSFKNDTVSMKSQIKDLLRTQNTLAQEVKIAQEQYRELLVAIDTAQKEKTKKKVFSDLLDEISVKESIISEGWKDIDSTNKAITELQQSLAKLNHDIDSLNDKKKTLKKKQEELQTKTRVSEEEQELQEINVKISECKKWLQERSPELDSIKTTVDKLLQQVKSPKQPTPPKAPNDKKPDEEKNPKDDENGTEEKDVKEPIKKEPKKGSVNETPEVKVRKRRDHKIKEIFDLETGETINAEEFFSQDIDELIRQRTIFQDYISQGKRRFVCPKCLEMIRISGRGDERGLPCIFTHKNDSPYCLRTKTGLSEEEINRRKYSLIGQSKRHKQLKQELCDCLTDINSVALGVQDVEMEKRIYSPLPFFNFRQPDVQIEYKGKKIVFEIQLSTTFLSVISERDTFYRLNGYYIIWVFNFEDNRKFVDLNNLAMKDIYFANKRNAFIFDEDARLWSKERKQLVLKCNWLEPDLTWHHKNTVEKFGGEPVTLDMLKYDSESYKPYFEDAEKIYFEAHPEKEKEFANELQTREDKIKELKQQAQDKDTKRLEVIEFIKESNGSVIPFEEKKRFGFKYGVTVILEPKFSSYENRENGTFIVGFNRKKGLVNQYGEMLRECEYINIHPLSGNAYLAEGRESFWLCNIPEAFRERVAGDYVTHEMTRERVELVKLYHRDTKDPFSSFYIIDGQKILAKIDGSTLFVDLDGNKIAEEEFSKMKFQANDKIQVQRKSDYMWNTIGYDGVYDGEWSADRPPIPFEHDLTLFYKGDCQGLKDKDGNVIVEPTHTEILADPYISYIILKDTRTERSYWRTHTITSYTLVGLDGTKRSVPEKFQRAFSIIRFVNHDKLQIGNDFVRLPEFQVIAEGCNDVTELDNGYLIVIKGEIVGLNSHNGEVIIPCEYKAIDLWHDEIYVCKKEERYYGYYGFQTTYSLIDSKGNIIQSGFQSIGEFIDDKARVRKGEYDGFIDKRGQIIPDETKELVCGLHGRKYLGFWEIMDDKDTIIIDWKSRITNIENFKEDKVLLQKGDLMGLINHTGKSILSCKYSHISVWANNLILIKNGTSSNNRYKLFNENGGIINNFEYDTIDELKDGKASVTIGTYSGYIDEMGQPLPDHEIVLSDGNIKYSIMRKWGLRSPQGETIIKCMNDEITSYKGYYVVLKSNEIEKTNIETTNEIPVIGVKSGATDKSIIFQVAGKDFLVSKSVAKKRWNDNIPDKSELIIINLCPAKNRYSWGKRRLSVIAKPYSAKKTQKRETDINESIQGVIAWINYGSAIVKLDDGSTVFVHKSNFKQIRLDKNYKGRKIEIKKIGVDTEHQKDVWEIINLENPVEQTIKEQDNYII